MKSLDEAVQKFKNLKEKLKILSQEPKHGHNTLIIMQPKQKQNIKNYQNTEHMYNRTSTLKQQPAAMKQKQKNIINNNDNNKTRNSNNCKTKQQQHLNKTTTNLHSKKIKDIDADITDIYQVNNDNRDQTKKKEKKDRIMSQHRKNYSWNFQGITKDQQQYRIDNQNQIQAKKYRQNQSNKLIRDKYIDITSQATQWKIQSLKNSRITDQKMSKDLKNKQKMLNQINSLLQKKKEVLEVLERKIGSSYLDLQDSKVDDITCKSKKTIRAPNLFQMQVQGRKRSQSKPLTIRWK